MDDFKIVIIKHDDLGIIMEVVKPSNITTQNFVNILKHQFCYKKGGAAGVLDPMATGKLIVALGKYTKSLKEYAESEKKYKFEMILGVQTLSFDNQEKVIKIEEFNCTDVAKIKSEIIIYIESLKNTQYLQTVPLFSSVKVSGFNLRKITRKSSDIEYFIDIPVRDDCFRQTNDKRVKGDVVKLKSKDKQILILLPQRSCKIYHYKINYIKIVQKDYIFSNASDIFKETFNDFNKIEKFIMIEIEVNVSKGTYIRKFASDIAKYLGTHAITICIERIS